MPNNLPPDLTGTRIRNRREAVGLKQRDLAAKAQISASYLNLIEHNRRSIAGKVLIDIAAALGVEIAALQHGPNIDVIRQMQAAIGLARGAGANVSRAPELASRFPGWAALIGELQARVTAQERRLDGLSDRLAHDPFLAETLHEILSSVTAIHATSGILDQAPEMEGLQQRRFQANIHDESTRLSDLSRGLASYFDRLAQPEHSLATPLDEVEAFLGRHGFHFPMLENGERYRIAGLLSSDTGLVSRAARHIAAGVLRQYSHDAEALPLAGFLSSARALDYDCAGLARQFHAPLEVVHRRLAFLPPDQGLPNFGLISCDGSGAFLLRKAVAGFGMPRYGAGCSLWPLYQAMSRPHVPLAARLQTNDVQVFEARALAVYADPAAAVPVLRATMIVRASVVPATDDVVKVGQTCRICPRDGCTARREPSIHGISA